VPPLARGGNVSGVRIVVCVKHVPDIQSDRALGPDGRIVRDGGDGTINELDENAVEAAVVLAEQARAHGAMFVDAYRGGEGHDMCAPAQRRWVEGVLSAKNAAPIHPNAAGMREVADRVVRTLARLEQV